MKTAAFALLVLCAVPGAADGPKVNRGMIEAMDMPANPPPRKGRGATSNASGRFETEERVAFDDGWSVPGAEPEPMPLTELPARAPSQVEARSESFEELKSSPRGRTMPLVRRPSQ